MKLFSIILLLFLSFNAYTQKSGEILATANGQNYTAVDLAPEARQEFENLPKMIANVRQSLLEQQINEILFEAEAAAQKTTVEKLIEREIRSKVPVPTDAQIKAVYEANRAAIGSKTLEEVRPQIVAFLRREPQQQAYNSYLSNLKVKYKATLGKDVNAANLSGLEVLASVADKQITTRSYDAKNKIALAEIRSRRLRTHARGARTNRLFGTADCRSQNAERRRGRFNRARNYEQIERLFGRRTLDAGERLARKTFP
jgi:hypothetical protein